MRVSSCYKEIFNSTPANQRLEPQSHGDLEDDFPFKRGGS